MTLKNAIVTFNTACAAPGASMAAVGGVYVYDGTSGPPAGNLQTSGFTIIFLNFPFSFTFPNVTRGSFTEP